MPHRVGPLVGAMQRKSRLRAGWIDVAADVQPFLGVTLQACTGCVKSCAMSFRNPLWVTLLRRMLFCPRTRRQQYHWMPLPACTIRMHHSH